MTEEPAGPTRPERLDRLPWTRLHSRLLAGSGIGWALDAMDVGLISFIMAALIREWNLTAGQASALGSIGFVGMAVGASIGGLLADRIGRRSVFALTLVVYGLATGASALAAGLAVLLALRFVVGVGLGAELPVASTLVSEYAPARIRGRVVVILEAFWAVGWIAAAVIGFFVVPADDGWRWALALGMVPAVYALYIRYRLPESVRFLESRGRYDDAERAVRRFETAAGVAPVPSPPLRPGAAPNWRALTAPEFAPRSLSLTLTWIGVNFAYYGAFIWLPSLLVEQGYDLVRSFGYTLVITLAQLPGYATAAVLIEKWGRRPTLIVFLAASAASAVAMGLAPTTGLIIAAGCLLSFFNLGAWGALYAVTPEVFPTWLRTTGAGAATAFGRVAAMAAPLAVPFLNRAGGWPLVFGVFAASFLLAMAATFFLPEKTGEALDEY